MENNIWKIMKTSFIYKQRGFITAKDGQIHRKIQDKCLWECK